jgi:hypothetical protein
VRIDTRRCLATAAAVAWMAAISSSGLVRFEEAGGAGVERAEDVVGLRLDAVGYGVAGLWMMASR